MKKLFFMMFFSAGILFTGSAYSYNNTADYWQCNNKVGGSWTFGRAPYACDVSPFSDVSFIDNYLGTIIFDDNVDASSERNRYMSELYSSIRDTAAYYLRSRKATVTTQEISAWQHAMFTIAYQESFWSHYRLASDANMKMMRGDYGHGHGLMQIDDRWHFTEINEGKGWHFVDNLAYAMEIFYNGWQTAPTANCSEETQSWRNRTRAAYSAYNGGSTKICRWTNPDDTWARNDTGFASKYDDLTWENYVADKSADATINISCMIEGGENCPPPGNYSSWAGQLLSLQDGSNCIFNNNQLHCVSDQRDAACLSLVADFSMASTLNITNTEIQGLSKTIYDRHQCPENMASLYGVGDFIQVQKNINLRSTPGGDLIGTTTTDSIYQILDFVLRDNDTYKRYYKVKDGDATGFVYAGNNTSYSSWVSKTSADDSVHAIPVQGDWLKINTSGGINLRATPGGDLVTAVPTNTSLEVFGHTVLTDNNRIYYNVQFNSNNGYIYGGQLLPDSTLSSWASYTQPAAPAPRTGIAANNFYYTYLKQCATDSCANTYAYFLGGMIEAICQNNSSCSFSRDLATEIDSSGDWVKIRITRDGREGWLKQSYITWD
jgi:hypothetical protein